MEMDKRDLDNLMNELNKFTRSVSTIGDTVKKGIKDGIKEGNVETNKKKNSTDDSDLAEKANNRLIMRHKDEYDASKDLRKSNVKTPEQEFNERTLKTQFSTNSYIEQLLKLTRDNQETAKKQNNIVSASKRNEPGFLEKTSLMKHDDNPYGKFIGSMADLGLQGKKIFSGVKEKISDRTSGSTTRQKDITKYTTDINRDKALLSAEEAKLEQLKKARGKNRNTEAIKEMEEAVKTRKTDIKSKSQQFADTTAEEYLYQKGKSDKNFKFKGTEKDLMKDQLSGNILHSATKDIFSEKKATKQPVVEDTILGKLDKLISDNLKKTPTKTEGDVYSIPESKLKNRKDTKSKTPEALSNKVGSIFDIPLKEASNPTTSGEYIVGIYREMKKKNDIPKIPPMTPPSEGGGMGMMGILSKLGPMLASLGPMLAGAASAIGAVAAPLAIALGGAYAIKKTSDMMDESNQGTTLSDVVVGGSKGFKAFLKGESFTDAFTGHQTERASKNFNREADKDSINQMNAQFDMLVKPKLNPNYVTADQIENLRKMYIDKGMNKIPVSEYVAARDSLIQQSKYSEQESATLKEDFTSTTGNKKSTKQQSNNVDGGNDVIPQSSSKEVVDTKSSVLTMSQHSGMDQMTSMTIQAKLIAMEMMAMNNSSDYINKQKDIMKTAGVSMAEKLYGGS